MAKKYKKYGHLILFLLCINLSAKAQIAVNTQVEDERLDSLETAALERPHIEISGTYVSLVAFNGRTEGVNQYGISPSMAVHLGKGFSINYEGSIWSANNPAYAFTSLSISKTFALGKTGEVEIAYSRWFPNTTNTNQRSDFNNALDLDTHWEIGNFTIGNYTSVLFNKKRALFFEPSIKYEIGSRFGKKRLSKWTITPSLIADLGNDVLTRVVRRNALRPIRANRKTTFGLLDFDASVRAMLSHKRIDFSVVYHYIVPKNTLLPNPTHPFSVWELSLSQFFYNINL